MRTLRDFHCDSCGKEQERYIESDVNIVECTCGSTATRVIGMPRVSLDGTNPDFPGAYDRWARIREENARIKSKRSYHGE
jgi:hypothetical protein